MQETHTKLGDYQETRADQSFKYIDFFITTTIIDVVFVGMCRSRQKQNRERVSERERDVKQMFLFSRLS